MFRLFFILVFVFISNTFAEVIDEEDKNIVDCLILQDEDSIVCKYMHERMQTDKNIIVKWIDPQGELSRQRTLIIPAGHGSIYDFRYIQGREKGLWQFIVIDGKDEYSTTFEIQ
ncbi:MAG: hypothetical protein ACNI25_01720 [Halarcobacter sp.]